MNLHELFDLEILPINLQTRIQKLVTSSDYDVLIDTAVDLVDSLRLLLIEHHTGNAENEVELDVLQEGSTHGLSYANKIRKAAGKEDIFGVGYAVHDLIRNMKLDLIKLEGNFDKSTTLQLPTERQQVYEELGLITVLH